MAIIENDGAYCSATFFFQTILKIGAATATPIRYFLAWRLPHQHYTDRYDGRHTTFSNTMRIEKNYIVLAEECH